MQSIERTFPVDPTTDRAIVYASNQTARPFFIGAWNAIRIMLPVALTPNGTANLTTAQFVVGLCSGTVQEINGQKVYAVQPYNDAGCKNFIGVNVAGAATGGTLTYNAGGGTPYFTSGSSQIGIIKKVNGVQSVNNTGVSFWGFATNTGATQRRSPLYVDITRGSPNYTVGIWAASIGTVQNMNPTKAQFLDALQAAGTPNIGGTNLVGNSGTIAFDEVAGELNGLNIYWNKSFAVDVHAIRIHKLS